MVVRCTTLLFSPALAPAARLRAAAQTAPLITARYQRGTGGINPGAREDVNGSYSQMVPTYCCYLLLSVRVRASLEPR